MWATLGRICLKNPQAFDLLDPTFPIFAGYCGTLFRLVCVHGRTDLVQRYLDDERMQKNLIHWNYWYDNPIFCAVVGNHPIVLKMLTESPLRFCPSSNPWGRDWKDWTYIVTAFDLIEPSTHQVVGEMLLNIRGAKDFISNIPRALLYFEVGTAEKWNFDGFRSQYFRPDR